MEIRQAGPDDLERIVDLLKTRGWDDSSTFDRQTWFLAESESEVIGCAQLVEVEPGQCVVDQVLVHEGHRGKGVGRALIAEVMRNRTGATYLCCHEERLAFYGHFGFSDLGYDNAPKAIRDYWVLIEDYPVPDEHVHFYLGAEAP
jgi:N-acetylglutamate synthase-like GNAT family acetyltransferase